MHKFLQLLEKGFELKDLLAETPDGYSQLYRGTNTKTRQQVFVTVTPDLHSHEKKLFFKALQHPSIPRFPDAFSTGSAHFLIQKYVEGSPLSTKQFHSLEDIQAIGIQLLEVLSCRFAGNRAMAHGSISCPAIFFGAAADFCV
jgi:hypothetical protein